MKTLITTPNMQNLDDCYTALLKMHNGKTAEESAALNAKLILLLANHIGDASVLREAISAASNGTT